MAIVGADVEQLRALSQTFTVAADRLQRVAVETSNRLNSTQWVGSDAERYRSQWRGESVRRLNAIAHALREVAEVLRRNADEQQTASAISGSAIAGAGFGGASALMPNPFESFRDFSSAAPLWPISNDTVLSTIPGVKSALPYAGATAIAFDSRLSTEEKVVEAGHLGYDTVAGGVRATAVQRGDPVGYLLGAAASQWGDVAYYGSKADFSPSTMTTVQDYIAADPSGAYDAAIGAIRDYVPKLLSNFSFW